MINSSTKKIIETKRLYLREMTQEDFPSLCEILQDSEVMKAYEGAFTHEEVQQWLDRQRNRYNDDGVGLWAVILKENDQMIGQCGLTIQDWKERKLLEIGYLFQKAFWHKGYATEAAIGCRKYAFEELNANAVYSIIRDTNTPSQKVAERNGMMRIDNWIKHYKGVDMPHFLYVLRTNKVKLSMRQSFSCQTKTSPVKSVFSHPSNAQVPLSKLTCRILIIPFLNTV